MDGLRAVVVWLVASRDIAPGPGEECFVSYGRSFQRATGQASRPSQRQRPANRTGNNALLWSARETTTLPIPPIHLFLVFEKESESIAMDERTGTGFKFSFFGISF